jgi:phosphoribosyl-ATP pyrophosphohydrolase
MHPGLAAPRLNLAPGGPARLAAAGGGDMQQRSKPMANFTLHDLEKRVKARAKERSTPGADASYTRKLLDRGVAHCAKKFGEEAIETVIAAVEEDRDRLIAETADLIYHLLVVLEARGIALADVEAVLAERTAQSGLQEKASRQRG